MNELGKSTFFRCDRCGHQAFGAAFLGEGFLLFCGHHLKRHKAALEAGGWEIFDNTHLINEKPSISANAG